MTISNLFPFPHILAIISYLILFGFILKARYIYIFRTYIHKKCYNGLTDCLNEMKPLTNVAIFSIMMEAKLTDNENLKLVYDFINKKYEILEEISSEIDFFKDYFEKIPPYYNLLLFKWNYIGLKKQISLNIEEKKKQVFIKIKILKSQQELYLDMIEATKSGL